MSRITALLVAAVLMALTPAYGVEIEQETGGLVKGTDWDDDGFGTIRIFVAHSDKSYVFWAHENGQPSTLARIEEIKRDDDLTSGTVKVRVSKSGGPGATEVGTITLDTGGITSILEGVSITSDFLTDAAMTVDQVTGPIEVGGSLLSAVTVLEDLDGAVTILNSIEAGADVEIAGDVLQPITVGEFVIDRTPTTYDAAIINAPITIQGDLAGTIYVYGSLGEDAPIHIQGDFIGGEVAFRGTIAPIGLWIYGDMNANVTIDGEKSGDLFIEGDLPAGVKLHMKGLCTRFTTVNGC